MILRSFIDHDVSGACFIGSTLGLELLKRPEVTDQEPTMVTMVQVWLNGGQAQSGQLLCLPHRVR
jgi:hypothetical protein